MRQWKGNRSPERAEVTLSNAHVPAVTHGIATEAWSPLGRGNGVLDDPAVIKAAEKHGRSAAQVVLRWHLQLGNVVIPKSVTPSRIRENIEVFDFELDGEDLRALQRLETGERVGPDPNTLN